MSSEPLSVVDSVDPHRIAEILVTRKGGGRFRGSGYRISAGAVLTARHVVGDAIAVEARFDAGRDDQWSAKAEVAWLGSAATDLAVLRIEPRHGEIEVLTESIGTIPDQPAVIRVQAAGFPLWKHRRDGRGGVFRDLHQLTGNVATLSNRRSGTLEIATAVPPDESTDSDASPWEGMSGAVVWAGQHVIGVVAEHHPREGPGRLTAVRIDTSLQALPPDRQRSLRGLLGLGDAAQLVSVLPAAPWWVSRSGYAEQVRDIAPAGGLRGREAELDELARFCASDETYLRWQAEPWAGKSALMATFASNPPAGVDVISFFITARLAAQADSRAFADAQLDQLSALLGESLPPSLGEFARDAHRRGLLREASDRALRGGRQLVLVVDGLDEDRGAEAGSGLPSIASLLPRTPPPAVKVILAGRPDPPIPEDVPDDHPVRNCRVVELPPSPFADTTKRLARGELDELLSGDLVHQKVIGFLTACGGGLSPAELGYLMEEPSHRLERMIGGAFGRTVAARTDSTATASHRVLLFTHETLRVEAISRLGPQLLAAYRRRIHAWADEFRAGWPADTPLYLLRTYPRMLREQGDLHRLVDLATDRRRHDRMLDVTGGDAAAFAEIKAAQDLILDGAEPLDLGSMTRLAIRRDELARRNANIPTRLPAAWAVMGHLVRAESLALGITERHHQTEALRELAYAACAADDGTRSVGIASGIREPRHRIDVLMQLALAHPGAQWCRELVSQVESEIAQVDTASHRCALWAELAVALATTDDRTRAALCARNALLESNRVDDPAMREEASLLVARALAVTGQHDAAARCIPPAVIDPGERPFGRNEALAAVVDGLILAQEFDSAQQVATSMANSYRRSEASHRIATAMAGRGLFPEAEHAMRLIELPDQRVLCLVEIARAALAAGQGNLGARLAEEAATRAREIGNWTQRSACLAVTAEVMMCVPAADAAAKRLVQEARLAANHVEDAYLRARALTRLIETFDASGLVTTTEPLIDSTWLSADQVPDPEKRWMALSGLARTVGASGRHRRAAHLTSMIDDPVHRARTWIFLLAVAPPSEVPDSRAELVMQAEKAVSQIDNAPDLAHALTSLAMALGKVGPEAAAVGAAKRAELVARDITDSHVQARGLLVLMNSLIQLGDRPTAERVLLRCGQVADNIKDPRAKADVLRSLAQATATLGRTSDAVAMARLITFGTHRDDVFHLVAVAMAGSRSYDDAVHLANKVADPTRTMTAIIAAAAQHADLDAAEKMSTVIRHRAPLSAIRLRLCQEAANLGDLDRADRLARSVTEPSDSRRALLHLARCYARNGLIDRVDVIIDETTELERRIATVGQVVPALAQSGHRDAALDRVRHAQRLIEQEAHGETAVTALIELSLALSEIGEREDARKLAQKAAIVAEYPAARSEDEDADFEPSDEDTTSMDDGTLIELARAFVAAGDPTTAGSIVADVHGAWYVEELIGLVEEMATIGATGPATAVARQVAFAVPLYDFHNAEIDSLIDLARALIPAKDESAVMAIIEETRNILAREELDDDDRRRLLSGLAEIAAEIDRTDLAESLVQEIPEAADRARAYIAVASALGPQRSRIFLARALTLGWWADALPVVLAVDPAVAEAVAADLLADRGHPATDPAGSTLADPAAHAR